MKTKKSLFISTIAMVVLLVVALSTGTFAWYTANNTVSTTSTTLASATASSANIAFRWKDDANVSVFTGSSVTFNASGTGADGLQPMIPAINPVKASASATYTEITDVNATAQPGVIYYTNNTGTLKEPQPSLAGYVIASGVALEGQSYFTRSGVEGSYTYPAAAPAPGTGTFGAATGSAVAATEYFEKVQVGTNLDNAAPIYEYQPRTVTEGQTLPGGYYTKDADPESVATFYVKKAADSVTGLFTQAAATGATLASGFSFTTATLETTVAGSAFKAVTTGTPWTQAYTVPTPVPTGYTATAAAELTSLFIVNRNSAAATPNITVSMNASGPASSLLRVAIFAGGNYIGTLATAANADTYYGAPTNGALATSLTTKYQADAQVVISPIAANAETQIQIFAWLDGVGLDNSRMGEDTSFALSLAAN